MLRTRRVLEGQEGEQTVAEDQPTAVKRVPRPTRNPIHGHRNIMGVKGIKPGFHACWVNEDNVERWLDGGYDFVQYDVKIGDRSVKFASQVGGRISKGVGNGVTAYLLECPEEVYQEELAAIHHEVDESEVGMREVLNSGRDGQYGGVKIGRAIEDAL